ncbi:MAG TPA: flagellar hook protein FlgE [Terracidiphilus sp.]|jgi:flagellar hook protein FlgE|nr:flagellar hook protein FlgE [Terracidiphilus sp.]
MASFSIPLSGLNADSTALNTIANDLANTGSTAFKSQTTNFADLFYQQVGSTGSGDPIELGAGVKVATNETDFTQGSINPTGNPTDVALDGSGFFVVGAGDGSVEYTRAGNFALTAGGALVTSNGLSVLGYPAVNGVVNTNAPLAPITIPVGQVQQPQATTTLNITANLDSSAAVGTQFPAQVTVYDSLGAPHVVTVNFTETAANTWDYSAALPAGDFASGVSTPITGTLNFDTSGNLASVTTGGVTTPVGTAPGDVSSIPLAFTGLADGAAGLNANWSFLGAGNTPTISQVQAASGVSATTQNGFAPGEYKGFTINGDGSVSVAYTNGQTQDVGQLALANVTNLQGLQLLGNGDYATTLASGSASVSVSGSAGLGTLEDGALEGSNVNLSAEFSNLIVAQRAFEANAKAVTTFDTVTEDTINLIR